MGWYEEVKDFNSTLVTRYNGRWVVENGSETSDTSVVEISHLLTYLWWRLVTT